MKKYLIAGLTGLAGLVWAIGLGLAFRTDSGMLFLSCTAGALAIKFGPSLVQGRFRDELRTSIPNSWARRYAVLFTYCLFAFPGILSVCGQWEVNVPGQLPYAADRNWTVAFIVALVLPAVMLLMWSHAVGNGRHKSVEAN